MKWTEEDKKVINENFGKRTLGQILELLPTKRTYRAIQMYCYKHGFIRFKSENRLPTAYTYNQEYFKKPTLINSFVAGQISADGCIFWNKKSHSHTFYYKVAIKDECIIDNLIKEFEFTGKKRYTKSKSPHSENISHLVEISLGCFDKNAEYLKQYYNLGPNKTERLGPTNLNNIYLNWAFLIGNIDGDGTIAMSNNKVDGKHYSYPYLHFCSASPHIIRWIKSLMDEYFPNHLYSIQRESEIGQHGQDKYYRFCFSGIRAAVVIDYLSQFSVPKLVRKWQNPKVLDYINTQKLRHPHLFKILNQSEIAPLLNNS